MSKSVVYTMENISCPSFSLLHHAPHAPPHPTPTTDDGNREGATFETCASRLDPRVALGHVSRETITLWSRRAARQFQRQLPPGLRLSEEQLVKMTAALPASSRLPGCEPGGSDEGMGALGGVVDPDVDALLRSSQQSRKR